MLVIFPYIQTYKQICHFNLKHRNMTINETFPRLWIHVFTYVNIYLHICNVLIPWIEHLESSLVLVEIQWGHGSGEAEPQINGKPACRKVEIIKVSLVMLIRQVQWLFFGPTCLSRHRWSIVITYLQHLISSWFRWHSSVRWGTVMCPADVFL